MLYVLGLVSGFASVWFVIAALQSFEPAGPARPLNVVMAIVTAALAALCFWAARRFKLLLLALLIIGAGALGAGHLNPATAAGEQIAVTTDPPLGQIHPHGGPSAGIGADKLVIEVKDSAGRVIPNVKLEVQMDAPATNWFMSTDVPRIEGQTVLNWSGIAASGRQEFEYIFPIRGKYHLTIKASPAPGASASFSPISQESDLAITEKPKSMLYLALFLAALFVLVTISGAVLGRANIAARGA